MSNPTDSWKWVDEDPIEKLLRPTPGPEAASTVSSPSDPFIAEGRAHFGRLRFEEAAGSYSAAIAAEPNHPTAHFDLGVCLEKLGQWKASANSFRRALEIDPGRSQALVGLGACLLQLDVAEQALACFERIESAGERESALLGKAVALQKLGRHEEAEEAYRELLEISPGSAEPLANLIALSAAKRDLVAMEDYASRLLEVNSQSKAALQGMAMVAIESGNQAAAVEYCTRLVDVDPDSFEGRFNLRFAQQKMQPPEPNTRSIASIA